MDSFYVADKDSSRLLSINAVKMPSSVLYSLNDSVLLFIATTTFLWKYACNAFVKTWVSIYVKEAESSRYYKQDVEKWSWLVY